MPREFSRGSRVADFIQRELAVLIQRELKDPRAGMITVNEVKVSRDLSFADVYFTVLPEDKAVETEQILEGASGFLRGHLAKMLSTRTTPSLRFHYDATLAHGERLERAIAEARARDSEAGN